MTPFYILTYITLNIFFRIVFRMKVTGHENYPKSEAFIAAANHVSLIDPPILGVIFNRSVNIMAKTELFKIPVLGPVIKTLGSFPVVRESADTKALKHAISLLKNGKIVGIFPEGRRSATGEMLEGELGMALMAKQTGAPVVPCAIIGTHKAIRFKWIFPVFSRFFVKIGKPVFFNDIKEADSNKHKMKLFTQHVMNEIKSLMDS